MPSSTDINLLKAKTLLPAQLVAIEQELRTISYAMLIFILCAGLFLGTGYIIVKKKHTSLETESARLRDSIIRFRNVEGLYLSVRERLTLIKTLFEGQRAWLVPLDLTERITGEQLTAIHVGANDAISLTVDAATVIDAMDVVDKVIAEASEKKLLNPTLDSVTYQKDGSYRIVVSFMPIF